MGDEHDGMVPCLPLKSLKSNGQWLDMEMAKYGLRNIGTLSIDIQQLEAINLWTLWGQSFLCLFICHEKMS